MSAGEFEKHIRCLFRYGCMYTVSNSNLLLPRTSHTPECRRYAERCVHSRKNVQRKSLAGTGAIDRTAFFAEEDNEDRPFAVDYVWYLWCGKDSLLSTKTKMATFERYFLKEKELHKEDHLRNEEKVCDMLLRVIGTHTHQRTCTRKNHPR